MVIMLSLLFVQGANYFLRGGCNENDGFEAGPELIDPLPHLPLHTTTPLPDPAKTAFCYTLNSVFCVLYNFFIHFFLQRLHHNSLIVYIYINSIYQIQDF